MMVPEYLDCKVNFHIIWFCAPFKNTLRSLPDTIRGVYIIWDRAILSSMEVDHTDWVAWHLDELCGSKAFIYESMAPDSKLLKKLGWSQFLFTWSYQREQPPQDIQG